MFGFFANSVCINWTPLYYGNNEQSRNIFMYGTPDAASATKKFFINFVCYVS